MMRDKYIEAEVPVVMVFGGCMGAIVAMEIVLKGDPKHFAYKFETVATLKPIELSDVASYWC